MNGDHVNPFESKRFTRQREDAANTNCNVEVHGQVVAPEVVAPLHLIDDGAQIVQVPVHFFGLLEVRMDRDRPQPPRNPNEALHQNLAVQVQAHHRAVCGHHVDHADRMQRDHVRLKLESLVTGSFEGKSFKKFDEKRLLTTRMAQKTEGLKRWRYFCMAIM